MIGSLGLAISALAAQQSNAAAIAGNIAHAITSDSAPKQTTMLPMDPGVAVGPVIASEEANVDLGDKFVNLIQAQQAYEAATNALLGSGSASHSSLQTI